MPPPEYAGGEELRRVWPTRSHFFFLFFFRSSARAFGISRSVGCEAYRDSIIERVMDSAWWCAPTPRPGAATIYLVIGSLHEEARLREEFGDAYDAYPNSGVPFYLPALVRSSIEQTSTVANLEGVPQ